LSQRYLSDEEIRQRAFMLWERDGRPDGRSVDYWLQAARELEDGVEPPSPPISEGESNDGSGNGSEPDDRPRGCE
jgi:hypothetical protein